MSFLFSLILRLRFYNRILVHLFATGNITIGSSRGFEEPFYFQLAKQFLGNRIGSYAAYLRFSIAMEECKTALDESILQRFPLVQIHSHDNLILNYFGVSARPHTLMPPNVSRIHMFLLSFFFHSPSNWIRWQKSRTTLNSPKIIGVWVHRLANRMWTVRFSWPHCRMWSIYSFVGRHRLHLHVLCKDFFFFFCCELILTVRMVQINSNF